MVSHKKQIAKIIFILSLGCTVGAAAKSKEPMRLADAKSVVIAGLGRHSAKIFLAPYRDRNDSNFYYFEASWNNTKGSMIVGHYAVDMRNAALWDVRGSVCSEIRNRSVERIQAIILRRKPSRARAGHTGNRIIREPIICAD